MKLPRLRGFKAVVAASMSTAGASTVLAFVRQLLIAAYFGVSRDLEIYLFAYAVALWTSFTFATVLDSMLVPHLVREAANAERARALARKAFLASIGLGLAAALLDVAATWCLAPIIATGFTAAERTRMLHLAVRFAPWILLYFAYYAAAARHKSGWRFNRVFAAELVVGAVSILWLLRAHATIAELPNAYCAGYAAAVLLLLPGSGLLRRSTVPAPIGVVVGDAAQLYLANQTGNLTGILERHFQSLISAGGIAALGYAGQLLMGLSSLLAMRDIFVVPLAQAEGRNERIERLMLGLVLLATPAAVLIGVYSREIVTVLFQRGHFGPGATALTAQVLRILAPTLVTSAIAAPLVRVLQIVRRVQLLHVQYVATAVLVLFWGSVFVVGLGLEAEGMACVTLATSVPGVWLLALLVRRCGIVLDWRRVLRVLAFAAAASAGAAAASLGAALPFSDPWLRLGCGGAVYAALVAGCYGAFRARFPRYSPTSGTT